MTEPKIGYMEIMTEVKQRLDEKVNDIAGKIGRQWTSTGSDHFDAAVEYYAYNSAGYAGELLKPIILEMFEVLKFECGNRCAEQNPCNAKEVLVKFDEFLNK